jgi:hypothetical protein
VILRCQRSRKEIEKIVSVLGGFAPIADGATRRWAVNSSFRRRNALCSTSVSGMQPAKICDLLGGHPAVAVEFD